jgi:hypothetical protein
MTPTERGVALALEAVAGVVKVHALGSRGEPSDERFSFLVEVRPLRGLVIAEAHYAIVKLVGRAEAARVTYGDADAPSTTLLRSATQLRLTPHERELALREAAVRALPEDEAWSRRPAHPLTILSIDNDIETHSGILQASQRTDRVVDVAFGLAVRAYATDGKWRQFDLIFAGVSGVRGEKDLGPAAPLDGLRLFNEVVRTDATIGRRTVFVKRVGTPLPDVARRVARAVLLKPLTYNSMETVIDDMRQELAPEPPAKPTADFRADVVALREKGGPACERLAELLEKALKDPEAYLAGLRAQADAESPASARSIPKSPEEMLRLLHESAATLLLM